MPNKPPMRRYDLDWLGDRLRPAAVLPHGHDVRLVEWHVKNPETSVLLEWLMNFLHQWRMPLLFFISGGAVWFALEKYPLGGFVRERFVRLFLPLAFGMLAVIPPQVYFERLFQGYPYSSFWEFYGTIFYSGSYPQGNLSWHHLWYIPYILVYSLLWLPVLLMLRTSRGRAWLARFRRFLCRPGALLFLALHMSPANCCCGPTGGEITTTWWGTGRISPAKRSSSWPASSSARATRSGTHSSGTAMDSWDWGCSPWVCISSWITPAFRSGERGFMLSGSCAP